MEKYEVEIVQYYCENDFDFPRTLLRKVIGVKGNRETAEVEFWKHEAEERETVSWYGEPSKATMSLLKDGRTMMTVDVKKYRFDPKRGYESANEILQDLSMDKQLMLDLILRLREENETLKSKSDTNDGLYVIEGQYNDPDENLTEDRSVYTSLEKAKEAYNLLKQYNYETLNLYKAGEDAYGEVVGVGEPIIYLGSTNKRKAR